MKIPAVLVLVLSLVSYAVAQENAHTRPIDSLKQALVTAKEDTNKVNTLMRLSSRLISTTSYDSALKYLDIAVKLSENIDFKKGLANAYNNIGNIHWGQGHYPEALKNYFVSLRLREEIGDKLGAASSYNNIGLVFYYQRNLPEAMKNYTSCLALMKDLGYKKGIATSLNNIGLVCYDQLKFDEALKNYSASLKIKEEIGDKNGIAYCYSNIGSVYFSQGKYKEALQSELDALKIKEEMGDKLSISETYRSIAGNYLKLKNYKESEDYSLKALALAKEIGVMEGVKGANEALSQVYELTGKPQKALECYKAFILARDSLLNEENTKATVRLEMNYEFDKKEAAEKLEQEKKDAVAIAESRKQRVIIWSICGILALVLAFAVFAYRSYLQKQKANIEITLQKHIIEEKQKEILDSIYYARRIQRALITSERYIEKSLSRFRKS